MEEWSSNHLFLQGINAPVFKEVDVNNLKITGEIPSDLSGIYMRNSPNPFLKPSTYNYPLEGDGMIHAVYFKDGKVSYQNRWILTDSLLQDMKGEKPIFPEFNMRNYANTNVISCGDNILALFEAGLPYKITPELETLGEYNFGGKVQEAMTAHPRFDPKTGELHFFRYSFIALPYLIYYVANSQGKIVKEVPIELPEPALLHDSIITENYLIFFHCPLVFDIMKAFLGGIPLVWKPDQGTKISLMNRHQGKEINFWLKTESFWMWHFMNAFEDNNQVIIDFAHYPTLILDDNIASVLSNKSSFRRIIDDRMVDFPIFDQRKTGQPYRFGYMPHVDLELIASKGIPNYFPELIQYDLVNKTSKVHRFKPGNYCGEATFVPRKGGESESDGYVMTFVSNEDKGTSDLVIIDAANFEEEPLAKIHLPVRVPTGFHGNWIST
ncbi:carotenoid oxygenase family protein [Okeania sp. SIO2B3]|uniref:carotenoid oxygenase family protein n=1 Tax=Okeania sp. SIO2B3 TaxID=2607784 RepID=UPI0025D35C20|nr:carotenoid oxygenase family protein [Okeania sp. SIO2B3]